MDKQLTGMRQDIHSLRQDVYRLQQDVGDIKLDLRSTIGTVRSAYCRPGAADSLLDDPSACALLVHIARCSKLSSTSMMSVAEIVADYVCNRRYEGLVSPDGGDCQEAAKTAATFFADSHSLMDPQVAAGVLYSPVALDASNFVGTAPDADGVVLSGMNGYKLDAGSCIWQLDKGAVVPVGARGYNHFVVTVRTLEQSHVAVDWGCEQFRNLPTDARLFIPPHFSVSSHAL